MTARVLVTGATGFVGKQIVRSLIARGAPVVAVVRKGRADRTDLPAGLARIVITEDAFAQSAAWWAAACDGVDTVVHAAWYAEPGKYLQAPQNLDCLRGTLDLARGAATAGIKRFVGVGTCFEYDLNHRPLAIDTPLNPLTPYAAAKAASYLMLSQWLPLQNVRFAWCRLFYLYGEGEDQRRLGAHLRIKLAAGEVAELTSGKQIRDFLDVAEAGRRIAAVSLGEQDGAFNICSGESVTVRQLAERIADQYGRRDLLRFGARPDNLVDPDCVVGLPNTF